MMDTQEDLVNTLSNVQEKASSQNLNKRLNTVAVNKNNPVHKINKSAFAPAIIKIINSITRKTGRTNYNFQTKIPKKVVNHNYNIKHNHGKYIENLYVGNLDQKVNEEDLYALFGLKSTKYLSKKSYNEFAMDEKTGKSKGHSSEELMKLNDLVFTGKNLLIEEARKKPSERRKFANKRPESVEQPKPGPSNTEMIPPK